MQVRLHRTANRRTVGALQAPSPQPSPRERVGVRENATLLMTLYMPILDAPQQTNYT
jgi:hypothetical protein